MNHQNERTIWMVILTNSYCNIASMTLIKVCSIASLVRADLKSMHPVNIDEQNVPTEYKAYTIKAYEDKTIFYDEQKNCKMSCIIKGCLVILLEILQYCMIS